MTADPLLTFFLPAALGIIMLGLGLSLSLGDFARVAKFPKPVLIGLACQLLLLPLACFFLAKAFGLAPALAVGLMLLAASPGGTTANLYSHLAHGDVALNITLTAVNSVIAILTMPLIVNLSLAYFMSADQAIPLQFAKVVQVFAIVLGPVAIGMWLRSRFPGFAERMQKPVKIISALFLLLIILLAVAKDWRTFVDYAPAVGGAALAFNLLSMAVGYCVPRLLKLNLRQAIAIAMEIGIHNGTLAIALALSPALLNNPTMAIPAAIYSLIMFITAALFGLWVNRVHGAELAHETVAEQ
ncbi:bile acid:sodium symporter family protein [Ectopseudomonas oleovorans]|jgi:BASS family bile acid:Na+ symporter|uniref:Bile acid:sodium symporter family protein n=2 Tax=Ectopseudomonas oleovorans TaxID=301 RepID=A0A061CT61_ECTOL|nr:MULTISPECIES: bile acid:sodium symporter family protein [Pseudomonas]MBQ1557427.1 bile acid:sodium symporter family protein [Pseudomonas sp.]MDH1214167.1 bile acid:sodium symporter family protein [Pseudomonas chengduensis]MDH1283448.1 bile acid:sodium symporter family protein [Pseudomonas chengduensis]MDH2200463.1 bile acid:sodium symporter family protein [Pseudomonas oleovorans]PZQ27135.1 MAG: bile acid:sodium symporter family protein [Pseudomonas oleovorans]|tara:strand:- start:2193 stop:3089 length:897 start_codon:yes stop_codon:yes gene_type:complete